MSASIEHCELFKLHCSAATKDYQFIQEGNSDAGTRCRSTPIWIRVGFATTLQQDSLAS